MELNEIIDEGITGYLCPSGEKQSLARSIIQLLSNPIKSIKMGERGRKRISDHFSFKTFSKSWLAAYKKLSV